MSAKSNTQSYSPTGGGASAPPEQKTSLQKGLGFFPSSIGSSLSDPIANLLKAAPIIAKGMCANSDQATILYESGSTIPLFNIETIAQSEGTKRRELLHSFLTAFIRFGFIGVQATNLQALIDAVHQEMLHYFRQPLEIKLLDWKKLEIQRGFKYRGSECGPKALRPDHKESFFVTRDFNAWPSYCRSFPRIVERYRAALREIHTSLMALLMESIGLLDGEGRNSCDGEVLRLAYYPPFKPGDDPKGIWCAAHRDKNVLSILSNATVPGLQCYSQKGIWEPVVVPPNHLIITTGLLLQHKTAGMIKARWHRVLNPGGKHSRFERLSTAFYGTWPKGYSLKPIPSCIENATEGMSKERKKAYLEKFPAIAVGDSAKH